MREMTWIYVMPVIKHLSLMLYAKFDGSILTIFNVIVKKVWLFCGHGVVTAHVMF